MKYIVCVMAIALFSSNGFAVDSYPGKTAEEQKMTIKDTEITRNIRQKIIEDRSLSVNAHNIKIISENGKVTLKGAVASSAEQQKVGEIAKSVAGKTPVVNETTISK
ncbi:BON domain-containing protein [Bdellovibrio bacteriovorus]|uniref:BON domain-containing protein n=1 Tax=Bdellovibrio TaxID=958 RepID=UPI0035A8E565